MGGCASAEAELPTATALLYGSYVGGLSFAANLVYYSYFVWGAFARRVRQLNFRSRLNLRLQVESIGRLNELWIALISIMSCFLFIWETYVTSPPCPSEPPLWMFCVELFFSTCFLFQFLVDWYASFNRVKFLFGLQAMVDIVTVIPVLYAMFAGSYATSDSDAEAGDSSIESASTFRFVRVMKFTRVLRLLRLFRSANAVSSATDDAIHQKSLELATAVCSILVVTTGFVQYMGNEVGADEWGDHRGAMQFHDALYYTITTYTTVGYGDIAPSSSTGRIIIIFLLFLTIVLIPYYTSDLLKLFRLRSAYAGNMKVRRGQPFVIITCDERCTGVSDFVAELFHEDHGSQTIRVCILVPSEPTYQMKEVLLRYKQITYLKGDSTNATDLKRAHADLATACFILTDRFCAKNDEQDSITVLRALNIKTFNPHLSVYVQILQPETAVHVRSAGIKEQNIVCVDETKYGLIGHGCVLPGFSTMLINLISSMSGMDSFIEEAWHEEYAYGLEQEIYSMEAPSFFVGRLFHDVVAEVYLEHGVLVFALGRRQGTRFDVALNPGRRYSLREGDVLLTIADDEAQISEILEREDVGVAGAARKGTNLFVDGIAKQSKLAVGNLIKRAEEKERSLRAERDLVRGGNGMVAAPAHRSDKDCYDSLASVLMDTLSQFYSNDVKSFLSDLGVVLNTIQPRQRERVEFALVQIERSSRPSAALRSPRTARTSGESWRQPRRASLIEATLDRVVVAAASTDPGADDSVECGEDEAALSINRAQSHKEMIAATSRGLASGMSGHIIVITTTVDSLAYLFGPLRSRDRKLAPRPIVILCPNTPTTREWTVLSQYPSLYFVKGSRHIVDLKRAGIEAAHCAIVLSGRPTARPGTTQRQGVVNFSSADAEVILNVLDIEFNPLVQNPNIRTMCELNSNRYINGLGARASRFNRYTRPATNCSSMKKFKAWDGKEPTYSPIKTAGRRDTHEDPPKPRHLRESGVNFNLLSASSYIFEPSYASGKVVAANFMESLLCQAFYNPCIITAIRAMLHVPRRAMSKDAEEATERSERGGELSEKGGHFSMREVPPSCVGKTYGEMLGFLLEADGILPVGLYRLCNQQGDRFVFTNPAKNVLVQDDDMLYIILPGGLDD